MKKILTIILMIFLSISVLGASIELSSHNYSPSPVQAGRVFDLILQVKNNSNHDSEQVNVMIELEWPFVYASEKTKTIEAIRGNRISVTEFKGIKIDSNAETKTYELNVYLWEGENKIRRKTTIPIYVVAAEPKIELINSSAKEITLGSTKKIDYVFKNIGGDSAKNIVFEIQEERTITTAGNIIERELLPLGSASQYIKELAPGEETTVSFTLSTNHKAELKNYLIPIKINFTDSKNNGLESFSYAGIKVTAKSEIDAIVNLTRPLYPGGETELVFDIFNTGKASAFYTVMEINGKYFEIEKPRTFIGTLESDDFDSIRTKISVSEEIQPGMHPIKIYFNYKDAEVNEKTAFIELEIPIVSRDSVAKTDNGLGLIFGILINVLALIGLFWMGKKAYSKIKK